MKRILALWLAAILISAQSCYAVVMVGFGQEAGGPSALYTAATAIWDFEGNAEATKGGFDLTENGTITYSSSDKKQGTHSGTLSSTSYYSHADNDDLDAETNGDWSVSVWVKDSNYYGCSVWNKYEVSVGGIRELGAKNSTTDKVYISQYEGANVASAYGDTLTDGTWYHMVFSYDDSAGQITVWVSGATFGSVTNGTAYPLEYSSSPNASPLKIGTSGTVGNIDGQIDELVWFKGKTINSTEAQAIFNGNWR